MKLSIFVFFILLSFELQAQNNRLKVYPFGLFTEKYSLGYERLLNETDALQLKISHTGKHSARSGGILKGDHTHEGMVYEVEYRKYFDFFLADSSVPAYITPSFAYKNLKTLDPEQFDETLDILVPGISIGAYKIWDFGLMLDFNEGVTYNFINSSDNLPDDRIEDTNKMGIKFNIALGYVF